MEEMKKAKLQRQYFEARNIAQGSKVRQTIDQNQAAELWKFATQDSVYQTLYKKAKELASLNVQGCSSILIVLFTKLSSPNLTWKNQFCSESTKAYISR